MIEGNEKKTDIHTQRPCHIFYIVPKFVVVPCEAIKRNSVRFHLTTDLKDYPLVMVATSWLVIKQIQLTLKSMTAEVPKNGMGVGPGIPSFLNTVYGAMQYLKIQGNKSDDD